MSSGTFVEAVLHRPHMYTLDGTVAEVFAFLEGFYSGTARNTHPTAVEAAVKEWRELTRYMAIRLGNGEDAGWREVAESLRRTYPDEREAFAHALTLSAEYWESPS